MKVSVVIRFEDEQCGWVESEASRPMHDRTHGHTVVCLFFSMATFVIQKLMPYYGQAVMGGRFPNQKIDVGYKAPELQQKKKIPEEK